MSRLLCGLIMDAAQQARWEADPGADLQRFSFFECKGTSRCWKVFMLAFGARDREVQTAFEFSFDRAWQDHQYKEH